MTSFVMPGLIGHPEESGEAHDTVCGRIIKKGKEPILFWSLVTGAVIMIIIFIVGLLYEYERYNFSKSF